MNEKVIPLRPSPAFREVAMPEAPVSGKRRNSMDETPMSFAANLDPEDEAQTTYYIYEHGRTYELGPDGLKPKP